jgi:hypothetical protein
MRKQPRKTNRIPARMINQLLQPQKGQRPKAPPGPRCRPMFPMPRSLPYPSDLHKPDSKGGSALPQSMGAPGKGTVIETDSEIEKIVRDVPGKKVAMEVPAREKRPSRYAAVAGVSSSPCFAGTRLRRRRLDSPRTASYTSALPQNARSRTPGEQQMRPSDGQGIGLVLLCVPQDVARWTTTRSGRFPSVVRIPAGSTVGSARISRRPPSSDASCDAMFSPILRACLVLRAISV